MSDRPLEDWEFPEDDAAEDEDTVETVACPSCGAAIYEDAEQCYRCGEYVVQSRAALAGWPWWFVTLGLIGILAVTWALSVGF